MFCAILLKVIESDVNKIESNLRNSVAKVK